MKGKAHKRNTGTGQVETAGAKMSHPGQAAQLFIIEDDLEMRSLLSEIFASEGYSVTSFADAAAALALLSQADGKADVIITDLNMPKMNGMTFLENAKKIDSSVPVIMMTAFGSNGTEREAYRKGASAYFSKPFQLSEVIASVRNAIAGKPAPAGSL